MGLSQALDTASPACAPRRPACRSSPPTWRMPRRRATSARPLNQISTAPATWHRRPHGLGINRELDSYRAAPVADRDLRRRLRRSEVAILHAAPGRLRRSRLRRARSKRSTTISPVRCRRCRPTAGLFRACRVLSSAQVLAQQLNGTSGQIQGLRSDAELGISDAVSSANDAMQRIAQINQQLAANSANDAATADLLDQRDQYDRPARRSLMDINVVPQATKSRSRSSPVPASNSSATRPRSFTFNAQGTMTPDAQWSADPTKSKVGTITLVDERRSGIDLIANKAIRSGQIAAYVEMRDKILVAGAEPARQSAAGMSRALSDQTAGGTAVTAGAASRIYMSILSGSAGRQLDQAQLHRHGDQHAAHDHFVRVDDPRRCRCRPTRPIQMTRSIGIDFSRRDGVRAVTSSTPCSAAVSSFRIRAATRCEFSTTAAPTRSISTARRSPRPRPAFRRHVAVAVLYRRRAAVLRRDQQNGLADHRVCRPHHRQPGIAGRSVEAGRDFTGSTASGDATRPNFHLRSAYRRVADLFAANGPRQYGGAVLPHRCRVSCSRS